MSTIEYGKICKHKYAYLSRTVKSKLDVKTKLSKIKNGNIRVQHNGLLLQKKIDYKVSVKNKLVEILGTVVRGDRIDVQYFVGTK
jgi:hypothetical protein